MSPPESSHRAPPGPPPDLRRNEPLTVHRGTVLPEWIDYNGHMNVAFYLLAFDRALDALFERIGLTQAYRRQHGVSTFALEVHLCYLKEVGQDEPLHFDIQMLDLDRKRFHLLMRMANGRTGDLCATAEWISAHMDMATRRMAPFRPDMMARLTEIMEAHRDMPRPEHAGRTIGIRRRSAPLNAGGQP